MGANIHMKLIYKDGTILCDNLYKGRCSAWFDNLQNNGWDEAYDSLPSYCSNFPDCLKELLEKYKSYDYYHFYWMRPTDYELWFNEKRPDIDAGWLTTYQKWQYERRSIYPEDIPHYLPKDWNKDDCVFMEVENPYNPDKYVIDEINKIVADNNKLLTDCYIFYCFDW